MAWPIPLQWHSDCLISGWLPAAIMSLSGSMPVSRRAFSKALGSPAVVQATKSWPAAPAGGSADGAAAGRTELGAHARGAGEDADAVRDRLAQRRQS